MNFLIPITAFRLKDLSLLIFRVILLTFFLSVLLRGTEVSNHTEVIPTTQPFFERPKLPNSQSWFDRDAVTGDCGGLRSRLAEKGIDFTFLSTNETWCNTTGGLKTGTIYTGAQQATTAIDFEKLAGWQGASFCSTWFLFSGQEPFDLVDNLLPVSSVASYSTLRSGELWIQQKFLEDKLSLRVGQLMADSEFFNSNYGALFINDSIGLPAGITTGMPNGGPVYPMGAPGARLEIKPTKQLSFKVAMLQGNVYPQNVNNHGFYWDLHSQNGYIYLLESNYKYQAVLPGEVKAGTWFYSGTSANPNGSESTMWGNYGIYGIVDQMLYHKPHTNSSDDTQHYAKKIPKLGDPGLGAFMYGTFAPGNRNLMDFYFETGLTYKGLIPHRDEDTLGFALAYGQLSSSVINGQQGNPQYNANGNLAQPIDATGLSYEMVLETTYSAHLTPYFILQPDLQYIIHPGGSQSLSNALVLGMRVSILL